MARKNRTVFMCSECGYESQQWAGRCICGAWNSFVEQSVLPETAPGTAGRVRAAGAAPVRLSEIGGASEERIDTGIGELNRVLGGGIVKGSLVLISGEPGIGKSTIIMQAARNIAAGGKKVLYVSGEESEQQIKLRADRICESIPDTLYVLSETELENIEAVCDSLKPDFLIIDSIQTMYSSRADSAPGSVSQVRLAGSTMMQLAKSRGTATFIVAHVTKNGDLAGPKTVEHLVDCVLHFSGERNQELRIIRSYKNRFGTTSEIGAFMMEAGGLTEVDDLSARFLENTDENAEGSVTASVYEGSRPVMFEIQALVTPANVGFARRVSVGIDSNRLSLILAVMEKKAGLKFINQDVYVNIAGGIRPEGTGTDLAVALAVYSTYKRIKLDRRTLAVGEVGLTGDIRSVSNADKIAIEAARLGYEQVIMPAKNARRLPPEIGRCRITGVSNIKEALDIYK